MPESSVIVLEAGDTVRSAPRYPVVALKNNLLYDAAATPNLQLEFRLSERWTLQAGVGFNPFPLNDAVLPKWRHIAVELAPRYWLGSGVDRSERWCDVFVRDFLSFNIAYAHYNVAGGMYPVGWLYKDVRQYRMQGDAVMAGVSYGWDWPLSKHVNIELEGGIDGGFTWYDKFTCVHCGKQLAQERKWFVVPRLGVNISVLLGGNTEAYEDRCDCRRLHGTDESEAEQEVIAEPEQVEVEPEQVEVEAEPEQVAPAAVDTMPKPTPRESDMLRTIAQDTHQSPEDARQTLLEHQKQLSRLHELVLRPLEEFEPYDGTRRITHEPNSIFMHFDVDETQVDRSFIYNDELLDSIVQVIEDALRDPTIRIRMIRIVGMASFDGSLSNNKRLANNRAQALHDYLQQQFEFNENIYRIYNGGECWQELRWYLEQETFPGKEDVLRIIDTEPDLEQREAQIKRLNRGQTYDYMRTHFKRYLRNLGTITVYYEKR